MPTAAYLFEVIEPNELVNVGEKNVGGFYSLVLVLSGLSLLHESVTFMFHWEPMLSYNK